jgi:hypothetical protein
MPQLVQSIHIICSACQVLNRVTLRFSPNGLENNQLQEAHCAFCEKRITRKKCFAIETEMVSREAITWQPKSY